MNWWMARMSRCESEIERECVSEWVAAAQNFERFQADCIRRWIFPLTYSYTGVYMG